MKCLLLLSGPLAVGKSTVAQTLTQLHHFHRLSTGSYLQSIASNIGSRIGRQTLQNLGDKLDIQTDYRWVVDNVARPAFENNWQIERWLFDCVRKARQVTHFRALSGQSIFHIHLTAPEEVLRRRYNARLSADGHYEGSTSYDEAIAHPNEVSARALFDIADFVMDVSTATPTAIAEDVVTRLKKKGG